MSDQFDLEYEVKCPYCGEKDMATVTLMKDLGYQWDNVQKCPACGKMLVYVASICIKSYTVNIPDEEIPR